ncbi:MAG: biopolymer transporter ExbD [Bacteroidetes bacterium]|jgi:biopolymer transport protein ExbD|nr:biopolymer transporter ExbD [Bacteroidota bacterium]MDA0930672.1 biopolymer transporter ExbD [Bacteroidota bacterium]
MSKFKKRGGGSSSPGINTASLPDIVFMLLFFFMVATRMREVTLQVKVTKPGSSQAVKIAAEDRNKIISVYVGKPTKAQLYGSAPRMQLNDVIADVKDVGPFVLEEMNRLPEVDRKKAFVSIKADEEISTGIITDIKEALRDVDALKIQYGTRKTASLY